MEDEKPKRYIYRQKEIRIRHYQIQDECSIYTAPFQVTALLKL